MVSRQLGTQHTSWPAGARATRPSWPTSCSSARSRRCWPPPLPSTWGSTTVRGPACWVHVYLSRVCNQLLSTTPVQRFPVLQRRQGPALLVVACLCARLLDNPGPLAACLTARILAAHTSSPASTPLWPGLQSRSDGRQPAALRASEWMQTQLARQDSGPLCALAAALLLRCTWMLRCPTLATTYRPALPPML